MSLEMSPQCVTFMKMAVFALNLILWFVGVVGVCVASLYLCMTMNSDAEDHSRRWSGGYGNVDKMLREVHIIMCTLIIVTGSILVIIGFLGCCGAALEKRCMLVTYAGLLGVALAMEIIIIGVIVWQKDQAPRIVEELVLTRIKYSDDYNHADWVPIHALQHQMKCCGVYSFRDYIEANHSVPLSCCNSQLSTAQHYRSCSAVTAHSPTNDSLIFQRGCGEVIRADLASYAMLGYVAMATFISMHVVGFVFSCAIVRSLSAAWSTPKAVVDANRLASYVPADEVQPYRAAGPPAYVSGSRHSSLALAGTAAGR